MLKSLKTISGSTSPIGRIQRVVHSTREKIKYGTECKEMCGNLENSPVIKDVLKAKRIQATLV